MLRELAEGWWLLHIRGLFSLMFGAFLLFLAGTMQGLFTTTIAMIGVLLIFVFYLILSGALFVLGSFKSFGHRERFWATLVHGSVMVALGSWLFLSNQVTVMWLVWFTVASALGSGLLELALAYTLRRHLDATLLTVAGMMSLAVSVLLIMARNMQLSVLVSALGIYAVFYGGILILLSLRLHGIGKRMHLIHHGYVTGAGSGTAAH